jgi:hypothetical protein
MRKVTFVVRDPTDSYIAKDLIPFLERRGLLSDDFLYTVVDGDRLDEILEHGTYRPDEDTIFSLDREALERPKTSPSETFDEYLKKYDNSAVAVYDLNEFDRDPSPDLFRFKNPGRKKDALVAIVGINWIFGK